MSRAKNLLLLLEKALGEDIGGGLTTGVSPGGFGGMGASNYAAAVSPGGGISINNLGRTLVSGVGGGQFRKKKKIGLVSAKYPEPVDKAARKKDGDKESKLLKTIKKRGAGGLINAKDLIRALGKENNSLEGKRAYFY